MRIFYYLIIGLFFFASTAYAQVPELPILTNLNSTLHNSQTFNNAAALDTIQVPFDEGDGDFSLEITVSVDSAVGEGMTIEFTNDQGMGMRTLLDQHFFSYGSENLSASVDNGQEQTFRFVVKGGLVHTYQEGRFLVSNELTQLQPAGSAHILIGKNYETGYVDMAISSVRFDDDAYAPTPVGTTSSLSLMLADTTVSVGAFATTHLVLDSAASLHLTNRYNPLINSAVELNSSDAALYFDNMQPADVLDTYLSLIQVNGNPALPDSNISVRSYGAGTEILPQTSDYEPLEVFTEENFAGNSRTYMAYERDENLGVFDNSIKSFRLKRGYMVTFATNADGTGFSRVFIAESEDLLVPVMNPYLSGTISFIRTVRWNSPSKKGWSGGPVEAEYTRSTWRYDWGAGAPLTPNVEYIPMKHNLGWESWTNINRDERYTHVLGYNEPDRPDQADMTVAQALEGWPEYLQSGKRLGSPSPSDPFNGWLPAFMDQCEELNYRVDYVAIHCYWNKSAQQWYNDLKWVYDRTQRPIWITEWNNGANWTTHSFPDGPDLCTDVNMYKQRDDLAGILNVLDTTSFVERYSIYQWVQDVRAMILTIDSTWLARNPDHANYQWLQDTVVVNTFTGRRLDGSLGPVNVVLTPAGEYYTHNVSQKAFNPDVEWISEWNLSAPNLNYVPTANYDSILLQWQGQNPEMTHKYVLERKLQGESDFSTFFETTDYQQLSTTDAIPVQAEYRVRVIGRDTTDSVYSNTLNVQQEVTPPTPQGLVGQALAATLIDLNWDRAARARVYNLYRSDSEQGTYEKVAAYTNSRAFRDVGLLGNTTYYYKVSAVNTGGESPLSDAVAVTTRSYSVPGEVMGLRLGSGDGQVKLAWEEMYDAEFYIKRSASASGPFATIANTASNSYTDTSVTNGMVYYYQVAAFNPAGEGADSDTFTAIPNLGQHLYYHFDHYSGISAHDIWGLYAGKQGTNASWGIGYNNRGLVFNNTSTAYLTLEEGVMEGLDDFTISTWVKLISFGSWSRIFDFGNGEDSWMMLSPQSGSLNTLGYGVTHDGESHDVSVNYVFPKFKWVHIALVQEGDSSSIYADGVELGRGYMPVKPADLGLTTANYLGKSQFEADPYMNGTLDEFRIYNRALSATEILDVMDEKEFNPATSVRELEEEPSGLNYFAYTEDQSIMVRYTGKREASYQLFTMSGASLGSGTLYPGMVSNLGRYSSGLYLIQVVEDHDISHQKILLR